MTPTRALPLAERARLLEQAFPRAPLCNLPTSVARADAVERSRRIGPLWIKHDERSARPYGGNKPRKLEWILGRARATGRQRVMTFGALGTNHGFATALYAGRLGLRCDLVLVHQPVDADVRHKLRLTAAAGGRLHYGANVPGVALRALGLLALHPRTTVIPTGGSSVDGVVGFVNAGLELAEQIERGELPEPARVYVALGTGGSAAGLAAGLRLGGLDTQVIAVLVTDILPPSHRRLVQLGRRTRERLDRAGLAPDRAGTLPLRVETDFVGDGYGHPTAAARDAVAVARDLAGVELETTYTGKALSALLELERGRTEPVLFWNTYAGRAPELPLPDWRTLPRSFHRFFDEEASQP